MSLQLLELPREEWETYFRIAETSFNPGIQSVFFPNGQSPAAREHSLASLNRVTEQYPGRYHFFKVVDTELPDSDPFGKAVGVSHWRLYPRERSEEEMQQEAEWSKNQDEQYGDPPGLATEARDAFVEPGSELKKKHLGRNPHLLLHVLATRAGQERRGVGALSLKWGTDKADELGLPIYLEGSPKGVPLYKKFDFEVVDENPWDATRFGYHEPLRHLCMLRRPKS